MLKKRAFWVLLSIGVVTVSAFNFNSFINAIFPEKKQNELVSRTISIKNTANQSETVVFKIPKGFLTTHVPREGKSINLRVGYPLKSNVSHETYKDEKNQIVAIYILAGDMTTGDKYKAAIDNNTLESRYYRAVLRQETAGFVITELNKKQKERNDVSQLFYDADREHWTNTRLSYSKSSAGEGMLKNLPILVEYSYTTDLTPEPQVMHSWVMSLVESFQVSNLQPSQGK